ncbi:hypothetical protein [Streptomyces griseorubiginosus]|uniref:hypothetical protein n=1 Tax=Streptomyces griseorubiginosus TaxID=67304 RepID=UPI0033F4C7C4
MTIQPGHRPAATQAGQSETAAAAQAFLADIESIMAQRPTSFRDETPVPPIGTTPPVTDQPGTRRPPMSQRAVDLNTTILSSSVLTAMVGGAATGGLWASGQANPTVIAWVCAGVVATPAAIAVPVLALKSLMKSAKEVVAAAPPEIHQHYNGYVDQRSTHQHSNTRGVIAITKNTPELPR